MAKKQRPAIPQTVEELTPAWYSEAMDRHDATVTGVDHTEIGVGIGFMGEIYRTHLTWSRDGGDLPASVVTKLPTAVDKNRGLGESLLAYDREIRVFTELADQLAVRMPEHYYSEMDPGPPPWVDRAIVWMFDTLPVGATMRILPGMVKLAAKNRRRYVLVMEDIADARPPAQVEGGSIDDALAALRLLARFHGQHWQPEALTGARPWIWSLDRTPKVLQASYRRSRQQFVERFAAHIGQRVIDQIDEVQRDYLDLMDSLAASPWCLLHGDYRLDNLLYTPDGEIVVLDWQLLSRGRPGWDVAYFITTALTPEHRQEEEQLLAAYHDELVAQGVEDYSLDDLRHDCDVTKRVLAHRMTTGEEFLDTDLAGSDDSFVDLLAVRVAGWLDPAP